MSRAKSAASIRGEASIRARSVARSSARREVDQHCAVIEGLCLGGESTGLEQGEARYNEMLARTLTGSVAGEFFPGNGKSGRPLAIPEKCMGRQDDRG
jgi:hypothetical protein